MIFGKNLHKFTVVLSSAVLLVALAWFVAPAQAGGWAAIVLDQWPLTATAGEDLTIRFRVLQHGFRPVEGQLPEVRFVADDGQNAQEIARATGEPGHYSAEINLPHAGSWQWTITAFGHEQPMPDLRVQPGHTVIKGAPQAARWLGAAGLAGLAAAAMLGITRRRRPALALAAAALLIGMAGVVVAQQAVPASASGEVEAVSTTPAVQLGRETFLAKGCTTCHMHAEFQEENLFSTGVGPTLTTVKRDAAYLRSWLKDPTAFNPGALEDANMSTGMPNLNLSDQEIEVLIAFLLAAED